MSTVLPLLAALLIGFGAAIQSSMLGAVGRLRGPGEAAWLSILATICGVCVLLIVRALRGDAPAGPSPFDRVEVYWAVAIVSGIALVFTARGVPPYYAISGLFGLAFIVGAATIAPRIGVALFLSAAIAGQLIGAMTMDHLGAFGAQTLHITPTRIAGTTLLLAGVALIRGIGR